MLSVKRADAKFELRTGPEPNAERSGAWPMSIIRDFDFLSPQNRVAVPLRDEERGTC
jgi:hypothetical protein